MLPCPTVRPSPLDVRVPSGDSRENGASIFDSVKSHEAHFKQLARELEIEHQSVALQLEKYKQRGDSDGSVTGQPFNPRANSIDEIGQELDNLKMAESHLLINKTESTVEEQLLRTELIEKVQRRYAPGVEIQHYIQESLPQVQESYSVSYQTSTNGHSRDVSPSSSQLSMPVDSATLISRSTAQTKTQQVKTVTKVITTREVQHIGSDGQPIDYTMYGGPGQPGVDYGTYPYNPSANDFGTYDSGRPPSPGGQVPLHGYPPDYVVYGKTAGPGRPYDPYAPDRGYTDYDYHNYPTQPPSPPSAMSDSPPPRRAMPQAPGPGIGEDPNLLTTVYDDMHPTGAPPRANFQSPYGYTGSHVPPTSPGYVPYEAAPPQGYLDRRPSYDEHPQPQMGTLTYTHVPRTTFEEEPELLPEGQMPPLRHPNMEFDPTDGEDVRWRDPDLHEVIEFLGHPNNVVRANAAAYLQHLCYMDDNMKQKTRALGGIPPLIDLLNQEIPEIQRNACGALRNLSYGRQNDENKRGIRNAGGIPTLVRLFRKTPDNEIRELITGVLWNLSSCEDLKRPIIDDALAVLVNHVIILHSGWDRNHDPNDPSKPHEIYWSTVFRNASGVLRNVSSAGEYARKKLRECEGLVDAFLHLVKAAIGKNDMDNKSVENCVCILRNLSYRCQEVEDPEYDKHVLPSPQSRAVAGLKAVGDNLGCFGASKKKKEAQNLEKQRKEAPAGLMSSNTASSPRPRSTPARGMELLWQPEVVQPYLALLSECSNPETLEAAAGAIQNLAACYWQPSIDIRAAVRKEKGLPILVELLRMEVDRVVCAVATALRNLAMDQRNKELIGKHAMKDLVKKLPNGDVQHDSGTSDDTIAAVLATLNEVIVKNCDFAHSLLEAGGVQRLMLVTKQKAKFSPRVVKFTSQVLYNMWQHQELREVYRKAGYKESNFITRSSLSRSASSPPSSANNTLNRPISTQGGTKYEDKTLPRGKELNSNAERAVFYSQSEDLPMSDMPHSPEQPLLNQTHRPPVGGVQIYPPAPMHRSPLEPVYAQVNRDKKRSKNPEMSSQSMLLEHEASVPAGDSWV